MNARVMAQTKPGTTSATPARSNLLQRKCACGGTPGPTGECEECRKKRLQRRVAQPSTLNHQHSEVPPIVHEALHSPGQPLDAATRAFFEPRFGHDFSRVRVHTDAQAAESARAVNARAYTVGSHIVFGAGEFALETLAGRKLLAHELAHTVQQAGVDQSIGDLQIAAADCAVEREAAAVGQQIVAGNSAAVSQHASGAVQRDLATSVPEEPQPKQPNLTDAQIRDAIHFNRQLYDEANTRLIQNMLGGGPCTGRWTVANIRAIAATQERFGLKKDGKVGPDTFRFIVREQELEGAGTETKNCLTAFRVVVHPLQTASTPGPGGTTFIQGHHVVEAQFSSRCNCSEFEYRQSIMGVGTALRGTNTQDLSGFFDHIPPGRRLPGTMQEDGNTNWKGALNYGHREQQPQEPTTSRPENRYKNDAGASDQPHGCFYRGEDFPHITVRRLQSRDVVDLLVQFRGEIQRNRRMIQTKNWTDIDTSVTTA